MTEFVRMCCGQCGIEFDVPQHFYRECRERGEKKTWYCPNGHPRVYGESDSDRLQRRLDRAIQEQARLDQELREAEERAEKAERREARLKKRIHAGVCPCCSRTFTNLARHMKTKHPEQLGKNIVKLKETA